MPHYHHPALAVADTGPDYALLETADGMKKERWGEVTLVRPDPQVIWGLGRSDWQPYDALYRRSASGGGEWAFARDIPEWWTMRWQAVTLKVSPTGFKHTGVFPEQAANWAWMQAQLRAFGRPARVLNLFGYTGAATVVAAAEGAHVTHVDAAKGMVAWCKENAELSGLSDAPIRFLVDDCAKFVARELRRGNRYDGILLDPPVFGRGAGKEMWKIEEGLWPLLRDCRALLSDDPCFVLLNTYTASLSPAVVGNLLGATLEGLGGRLSVGELGLQCQEHPHVLPCGVFGRWERG
jgi:23S rRNA (cytosine1962-C5)-methyltransferase